MSNHSGKFIAAIFASFLAGTSFAAGAEDGAKPADDCLSGPKGTAPAGHHWYYRIDRATKRQCWYSRAESDKTARAAPRDLSPPSQAASSAVATNPAPPPPSPLVPKSIADARAELTGPQMRIEQDTNVNAEPRIGGMAPAASLQNIPRATAPDALAPSSPVASRWPESSGVISVAGDPGPAAAEPPASPQADAAPAPRPATPPLALATADSLQEKRSASMQMLLLVMVGALALAGVTASLVFRFGRAQAARPHIRSDRRAIWDQVDTPRSSPSMSPDEDMPIWRANVPRDHVPRDQIPHDPRAPDDPERRVTEMLARLARSAQS
jgi:hypothetical protein